MTNEFMNHKHVSIDYMKRSNIIEKNSLDSHRSIQRFESFMPKSSLLSSAFAYTCGIQSSFMHDFMFIQMQWSLRTQIGKNFVHFSDLEFHDVLVICSCSWIRGKVVVCVITLMSWRTRMQGFGSLGYILPYRYYSCINMYLLTHFYFVSRLKSRNLREDHLVVPVKAANFYFNRTCSKESF